MKKLIILLIALVMTQAADARLNVVVTTPDIGSIAQAVGGELIELSVLVKPREDPHFVEPKPSLILKLNRADVLIEGGGELEAGWLPSLISKTRNAKIAPGSAGRIKANDGISMLEVPTELDRSKGDIHAAGNPHFLADPGNAVICARKLADALAKIDPASAEAYQANAGKFVTQLEAKIQVWEKQLASCRGECVVAYHNSWIYFGKRFGFEIDLFLEPKPGIPPTPGHLADILAKMKQRNAHVIMVDPYLDRRTAESVASRTGAEVVDVSHFPGGVKGTEEGYIVLMDHNVNALAKAFAAHR
jgi:ABC-type Zn uptake system ZnuABC Zn-binding protein ZnuA